MDPNRSTILHRIGIAEWRLRGVVAEPDQAEVEAVGQAATGHPSTTGGEPGPREKAAVVTGAQPAADLDALERQVAVCQACELAGSRTHTVFGVGNRSAAWMLVGEAPTYVRNDPRELAAQ